MSDMNQDIRKYICGEKVKKKKLMIFYPKIMKTKNDDYLSK